MGGIFIEHHAAGSPTIHNEGARRFDAHYLSRNSIRLSRKHRRVSNHFDVILTFKLGIYCIPLPWACLRLF